MPETKAESNKGAAGITEGKRRAGPRACREEREQEQK